MCWSIASPGTLIPASQFRQQMETDSTFRQNVLSSVALRFSEYQQLVEDVALTGFDARLARVLLRLVDDGGEVHASHHALATETASGRAFVSRRMAEMARALNPGGRLVVVDSIQVGDHGAYDKLLDRFPMAFHEPYYSDYIRDPLEQLGIESGLRHHNTRRAFFARIVTFDKPNRVS